MTRLNRQYPGISEDDKFWAGELRLLETEFGYQRVDVAIAQMIAKVAEFPNIAKLREFIPPDRARVEIDAHCQNCGGTGFERCRHCDCRTQHKTDTGLDGEPDPGCPVCCGRGSLVDSDRRLNNRVRSCACKRVVAA